MTGVYWTFLYNGWSDQLNLQVKSMFSFEPCQIDTNAATATPAIFVLAPPCFAVMHIVVFFQPFYPSDIIRGRFDRYYG